MLLTASLHCLMLNTGNVGGMVRGQKITVKDSVKVMEMIARDKIKWGKDDFWGYEVPLEIPGIDLERFDPQYYYSDDQIQQLTEQLKRERLNWLSQFLTLNQDIMRALKS